MSLVSIKFSKNIVHLHPASLVKPQLLASVVTLAERLYLYQENPWTAPVFAGHQDRHQMSLSGSCNSGDRS